ILVVVVLVSGYSWYESRALPDLGREDQVTTLPPGIANVLGANSATPQISIRIPILMYHYVEYVPSNPGIQNLNIPPYILTSQIETLKSAGYTFLTPNELTGALDGKRTLPTKVVILSFDDGYMDFYTTVFPILQKENVKAVAYIITGMLDRPNYM